MAQEKRLKGTVQAYEAIKPVLNGRHWNRADVIGVWFSFPTKEELQAKMPPNTNVDDIRINKIAVSWIDGAWRKVNKLPIHISGQSGLALGDEPPTCINHEEQSGVVWNNKPQAVFHVEAVEVESIKLFLRMGLHMVANQRNGEFYGYYSFYCAASRYEFLCKQFGFEPNRTPAEDSAAMAGRQSCTYVTSETLEH